MALVWAHTLLHDELEDLPGGDTHTQYVLLAGRTGGQTVAGGDATGDDITIKGTAHADNNGDVALNPDGGDVVMFNGTDVGDTTDGHSLYVHRKAAEGDNYLRAYVTQDQDALIRADTRLLLLSDAAHVYVTAATNFTVYLQVGGQGHVDLFSSSTEGTTRELRVSGYRTGDALRSIQIGVGVDADDTASFDGVSSYWFDGAILSTNGAKLGDGGTTDYTEVEADGTLVFHGAATTWDDENVGGLALGGPAASLPDEVQLTDNTGTNTGIYTYGFATGEKVSGSIEVPHGYKEGSDLQFHVHWQGDSAPTGTDNVKWELTYTISQEGSTLPAVTTTTVETGYDTQYERVTSGITISDATVNMGDQFAFTLERVAASADEYGGDAKIFTVGLHVEKDTIGSRQITTK